MKKNLKKYENLFLFGITLSTLLTMSNLQKIFGIRIIRFSVSFYLHQQRLKAIRQYLE